MNLVILESVVVLLNLLILVNSGILVNLDFYTSGESGSFDECN